MGFKTRIKTSSPGVLNAWLLFATIMVITLLLLFYSFVYVKNNEEKQIEKRFRILTQMGKNIIEREKAFIEIAAYARKVIDDKKELAEIKKEIKKVNKKLNVSKYQPVQGSLVFEARKEMQGKSMQYFIYVSAEDFVYPLKRPDVFDEFIVLEEQLKQTGSNYRGSSYAVLYHTFLGDIDAFELEKLKKPEYGIGSAYLTEIRISNKDYKLFLQPLRQTAGSKWYHGGLIEVDKFAKETRGLKARVIITFFIGFFIFILIIPFLKLFLMSNFEPLDIKDVILTTLSITFATILLILLGLFIHQTASDTYNVQENLDALAQKIKINFTVELQNAFKQLEASGFPPSHLYVGIDHFCYFG
jgi:hypothetical protein